MTEAERLQYRENNYNICTAIDMTRLGIVLDHMTKMDASIKHAFHQQASGLLKLLRAENLRLYGTGD